MSAATMLTDAFAQARAYWLATAGGTRAGLITHFVTVLGVTTARATAWTDAITAGSFDVGFVDDSTYPTFKARLVAVGAARGFRMTRAIFDHLTSTLMAQEAKDALVAQLDEQIAALDATIAQLAVLIAAEAPGTVTYAALGAYLARLNGQRASLVAARTGA